MKRQIQITAQEWAGGQTTLAAWTLGDGRQSYADTFAAVLSIVQQAERVTQWAASWEQVRAGTIEAPPSLSDFYLGQDVGGRAELASQVAGPRTGAVAVAYLAALGAVRQCVTLPGGWRQSVGAHPTSAPQLGAFPFAVAGWTVVGITAVAAAAWWGADRQAKVADVKKFAVAAQVSAYLTQAELAAASGQPIPPPPGIVTALADQEASYAWILPAAGALAAVGVGVAAYRSIVQPRTRANPIKRRDPAPRRRRANQATKRKPRTSRRRNASQATTRRDKRWKKGDAAWYTSPSGRRSPVVVKSAASGAIYVEHESTGASTKAAPSTLTGRRKNPGLVVRPRKNPAKRKTTKRKTTKRKTTKRKTTKRKTTKRKTAKRKTTKRATKKRADWLQKADREIQRDGTQGAFTRQARRAGWRDTLAYARAVMAAWRRGDKLVMNQRTGKRQRVTKRTMERANFAINAQRRRR